MTAPESILTYEQLEPEQKVFLFNFIFEEAAKQVFAEAELTAYSSYVSPTFVKARPRTEIFFTPGPGQLRWAPRAALPVALQNEKIESAYKGTYHFHAITAADSLIHGAYVVKIRSLMTRFKSLVNNVSPMLLHKVQLCTDGGSSPTLEPQTGTYQTVLIQNVDFSIQADAWALLA